MVAVPKPVRKKDRAFLDSVTKRPCCICKRKPPSDPSHIKTRGSGGSDKPHNVVPMCRIHHIEWGQLGPTRFFQRYGRFYDLLFSMGWKWFPASLSLLHDEE